MAARPDRRLCDLPGVEHPVIQAPMAGASTPALAGAVADRGGVGSLGFALTPPFDETALEMVLAPIKAAGIVVMVSAASPAEAEALEAAGADAIIAQGREGALPGFPLMNPLTAPLRMASARAGDGAFMSLWSGQAVEPTREAPAGELFEAIVGDALAQLAGARAKGRGE